MEAMLKKALGASEVASTGYSGGGCINSGQTYLVDGRKVYVKRNSDSKVTVAASRMQCYKACSC